MTKDEILERIAEDVGMCYSVKSHKNAIKILCDLLFYTNIHTKWKKDVISAINGICPEYFKDTD